MAAPKRVPVKDRDVYDALAAEWREAYIEGTGDKDIAVANFSYVSERGTWLVRFGADHDCWVFPEDEPELTSDELRDKLGLAPKRRQSTKPGKAEVLLAAKRLAAMLPDIPDDIAAVLAAA